MAKLLEYLSDTKAHHSVRVAAIQALNIVTRKGDKRVLKPLIECLGDSEEVCIAAFQILYWKLIQKKETRKLLKQLLNY